jgi:hypothetical protein
MTFHWSRLAISLPPRRRRRHASAAPCVRTLKHESLESRLLLTTFTVNSLADGPVNNVDFIVTLRDAINAANTNVAAFPGGPVGEAGVADVIQFQQGLTGAITLLQGQLVVAGSLSMNGPGYTQLSISGGFLGSRVFAVTDNSTAVVPVTFRGLTITQGQAITGQIGGGILNFENLRLENCFVTGNVAQRGGGIFNVASGILTVVSSRIDSNASQGTTNDAGGSALFNQGNATLIASSVSSNSGSGDRGPILNEVGATLTIQDGAISNNVQNSLSGGITNMGTMTVRRTTFANNECGGGFVGAVLNGGVATLVDCTIAGHAGSAIGGVDNFGTMTMVNSTISGNSGHLTGGVYNSGTLRLQNSTISGNTVTGSGGEGAGGVYNSYSADSLILENCTISLNRALDNNGFGGFRHESIQQVILHNTIVIDNFKGTGSTRSDVTVVFPLSSVSSHNLVGTTTSLTGSAIGISNGSNGNQVGVTDAKLGPLAANGGRTQTLALLAGSPAINAGSNAALPADPLDLDGDGVTTAEQLPVDQRGFAFNRIVGGQVDIGAFESGAVSADFDLDLDVDGNDFLAWQRGLGATGSAAAPAVGNADADADVDANDLAVWKLQFGLGQSAAAASAVSVISTDPIAAAPATNAELTPLAAQQTTPRDAVFAAPGLPFVDSELFFLHPPGKPRLRSLRR